MGTFGTIFFVVSIYALYRYGQVHKHSYAIMAALALCISVYQLTALFRNQSVEITADGITVSNFGRKTHLTRHHLLNIEYHHTCIACYEFCCGTHHYQITPMEYHDGPTLLSEFQRLFGS